MDFKSMLLLNDVNSDPYHAHLSGSITYFFQHLYLGIFLDSCPAVGAELPSPVGVFGFFCSLLPFDKLGFTCVTGIALCSGLFSLRCMTTVVHSLLRIRLLKTGMMSNLGASPNV